MRKLRIEDMTKGWFVGNFSPTALRTDATEVAVKHYQPGDYDEWHYHKIATEVTVLVSGLVEMNGQRHGAGEVLVIEPGEGTDFRVIEPTVTVVVKIPGATNDKFLRGQ